MVKTILSTILLMLLVSPLVGRATWQIATPTRGTTPPPHTTFTGYPGRYQSTVTLHIQRGYLYDSIKQATQAHGWLLIWYPRRHYPVFTPAEFSGDTFINAMSRFMSHYPLVVIYHIDDYHHLNVMIVKPIPSHPAYHPPKPRPTP